MSETCPISAGGMTHTGLCPGACGEQETTMGTTACHELPSNTGHCFPFALPQEGCQQPPKTLTSGLKLATDGTGTSFCPTACEYLVASSSLPCTWTVTWCLPLDHCHLL